MNYPINRARTGPRIDSKCLRYDGILNETYLRTIITAYRSWGDQRYRCNNPKSPSYKWYGKKGIKVEYGSREFVNWWLVQQSTLKLVGTVTCDRIDPSKNYSFDNIQLLISSDNSKKVDQSHRRKMVINILTGDIYLSIIDASMKTGRNRCGITYHCNGKSKQQLFKWAQEEEQ